MYDEEKRDKQLNSHLRLTHMKSHGKVLVDNAIACAVRMKILPRWQTSLVCAKGRTKESHFFVVNMIASQFMLITCFFSSSLSCTYSIPPNSYSNVYYVTKYNHTSFISSQNAIRFNNSLRSATEIRVFPSKWMF